MRRPISSKSNTCTESMDVNAAVISVKVAHITRGDLVACPENQDYKHREVYRRSVRSQQKPYKSA
jgi:hypothetical protein